MRNSIHHRSLILVPSFVALAVFVSCSDDGSSPGGSGNSSGTAGSAGSTASGGSSGSGQGGSSAGSGGSAGKSSGGSAGSGGTGANTGTGGTGGDAGGDQGDGGTDQGSGGAGEPSCELPFTTGAGGEGGGGAEGGAPGLEPAIVSTYTFEAPGSISGWEAKGNPSNGSVGDSFINRTLDEGASCPGALALTVPFSVYGDATNGLAQANFNQDWTGRSALHVAIKIADPGTGNLDYLNGAQIWLQTNNWSVYTSKFVVGTELADFEWHSYSLDISELDLAIVNQVGVQLVAKDAVPEGGPTAPLQTVLYIDDLWLE